MNLDYSITFINDPPRLTTFSESLTSVAAIALDIETVNWWHPRTERVALIQIAYRVERKIRVAVIDALAKIDPTILRAPLELGSTTKVMHNAAFDAVRLSRHFRISAAPIHDTLVAARQSGEKRYSLKAQVEKHLHLPLDKSAQRSDWSLRPLHPQQLAYAARDAVATLLLYEHQINRGLTGGYRLRAEMTEQQTALPLNVSLPCGVPTEPQKLVEPQPPFSAPVLSAPSLALLGIITELPSRYYPEQLAVSIGEDRVGLTGWIIDRILGEDADLDESTAKLEIAGLCQNGLISITPTRRLEANEVGRAIWHAHKPG
jgi:hypothetical protein